MAEQPVNGPPTKKQRSDVWQYYDLIIGQKKARCLLRTKYLLITVELLTYVSTWHHNTHQCTHQKKNSSQTTLNHFTKMKCSEALSKEITELITKMVAVDLRPLRLVEG